MKKHYCIDFEEGCRFEPCSECCEKSEGWTARENMPDSNPNKSDQDVDA